MCQILYRRSKDPNSDTSCFIQQGAYLDVTEQAHTGQLSNSYLTVSTIIMRRF
jgi:hypothetical protein